jgi:hypothetical protein
MLEDKFCYRTEVTNNNGIPIKIVWFDFYFNMDDGCRYSNNITNGVMREDIFLKWYSDGQDDTNFKDGWLLPGKTAVGDPNWNYGCEEDFHPGKWAYIAVDSNGNSHFAEPEITKDSVIFHKDGSAEHS